MNYKVHLLTAVCVTSLLGSAAMAGGDKLQFSAADADSNGAVSHAELVSSMQTSGIFERIDVNDNDMLEEQEADNDLIEYDKEVDFDSDGALSRTEFAMAVFADFDDNDDNVLDIDEYEDYSEQVSELLQS